MLLHNQLRLLLHFCFYSMPICPHFSLDSPWCEIKPSHAAFQYVKTKFETKKKEKWQEGFCVKSRNEPAHLMLVKSIIILQFILLWFIIVYFSYFRQVLEVVSAIKEMEITDLANVVYENTLKLFFNKLWK